MILSDQTTFRIGGATGLLLLLSAICILPLAAMVRADDKPAKENAAAQARDAEKNQPKGDALSREKGTAQKLPFLGALPWIGGAFQDESKRPGDEAGEERPAQQRPDAKQDQPKDDERSQIQNALKEFDKLLTPDRIEHLKRAMAEADERVRWVARGFRIDESVAMGELKKLGFDDKLIEALVKDRVKAKSANQVLQNILSLTGEDGAKPKQDKAGKE